MGMPVREVARFNENRTWSWSVRRAVISTSGASLQKWLEAGASWSSSFSEDWARVIGIPAARSR